MKGLIGSILVVLYLSWLCTFCLDCYWYGGRGVEGGVIDKESVVQPPFPGKDLNNIFWFIQVSDIHLSVHHAPSRISDLEAFFDTVVSTVQPSLMLITGDLTDAKAKNQIFAKQFELEWKMYNRILSKCPLLRTNKTILIDVRGNHDAFDVMSQDNDFFKQYSMSGKRYNPVFLWQHRLPYGQYSFLAIDATPIPGPRRPYNFFGVLDTNELEEIERALEKTKQDNMTIVLTHYPSSLITTDHPRLRRILKHSVAHLCGHLHTFLDYAPTMYGCHPDGHLELELADWKQNRKFRLLAIDHDILSFVDMSFNDFWPIILITNPTNTQFSVPDREPIGRISHSTHIRVLVFSPFTIIQVAISIDNDNSVLATPTGGGLYTLEWNPILYSSNHHTISVYAEDSNGNTNRVQHMFSLDGSHVSSYDTISQFILLSDFRSLMRMSYFFVWLLLLAYILIPSAKKGYENGHFVFYNKGIFLPLLLFVLYNGIGPLYVAEVLSNTYGMIWSHGVYVAGYFVPGSMTYFHSTIELCLFVIPLTVYLRFLTNRNRTKCHVIYHVMMGVSFIYELWGYSRVVRSYGIITIIISPGYSWGFPLSIVLIWKAMKQNKI